MKFKFSYGNPYASLKDDYEKRYEHFINKVNNEYLRGYSKVYCKYMVNYYEEQLASIYKLYMLYENN